MVGHGFTWNEEQLSETSDDFQESLYRSTFARCGLVIEALLRAYYAGKGDPQRKHINENKIILENITLLEYLLCNRKFQLSWRCALAMILD